MVERARRERIESRERAPTGREWEVFVRSDGDDPLRHVGSVRAGDADGAHELASRLFAWHADDVWVCPAEEMTRFTTHDLAEETTPTEPPTGEEPRNRELS